jgi:dienelactone hydrolase
MPRSLDGLALLILCTCLTPHRAAAAPYSTLWSGLSPGPHAVGYRRLADSALTVHIWYPAKRGGVSLTFGAYLGADSVDVRSFMAHTGVDTPTVDQLLRARLIGVPGATREGPRAPLVLIAHGNGQDVADQVVLCEYLASNGYVVAATPSPLRRVPLEREDQVGERAELQATELASAIARVAAILPVDTTRIAVIGHSFGARPALLLAMRDPHVRAIVSLDGGIGTATAQESFRAAPSFHASVKLPPLLHFYETIDAFMKPDFTLLESLQTVKLTLQPTQGMHHTHFTTYGFAAGVYPAIAKVTQATPETRASVVAVAKQTLAFLKQALR